MAYRLSVDVGELLLTSYYPSHALRTVVFQCLMSSTVIEMTDIEMTNNCRLKDALCKDRRFPHQTGREGPENLLVMFAYCGAWPHGFAGRA